MAGGMDLGTADGGGKKPLDMTINLVPFIDLMAVTIAFLIMTAVWTQVGRLQVSSAGAPAVEEKEKEPDPSVPVALLLTTHGFKLSVGGVETDALPQVRDAKGRLSLAALRKRLEAVRDQVAGAQSITLNTEDDVRYDDLVGVIDTCIAAGLPGVKVAPATG